MLAFSAVKTRLSALPKIEEKILAPDRHTCTLPVHLHPSSNNSFQPQPKQPTNKGIVRMHLPEPAQLATLWISSIGRRTEDNRKAIGIQCLIGSNSCAKDELV